MKEVIIVDDDYLARSYLKSLPSWEKQGFHIAADAQDGEEGSILVEELMPDLVVTDISMPLMDGIELIRRIRRISQRMYIIVLSCHEEFEYVREAMREGADDYVLKNSLDEESLDRLLADTKQKIAEKNSRFPDQGKPHLGQMNAGSSGTYQYFNQILAGALNGAEREQERIRLGIRGTYQISAVVSMMMDSWREEDDPWSYMEKDQYCLEFLTRLQSRLTMMQRGADTGIESVYLGSGVLCCFIDFSDLHSSHVMHQKLTETASACHSICSRERYSYKVGVSSLCFGDNSLRQAYQQAREILKQIFYEKQGIIYYTEDKQMGDVIPDEAQALLTRIRRLHYEMTLEEALELCQKAAAAFENARVKRDLVVEWLKNLEAEAGISHTDDNRVEKISQVYERTEAAVKEIFRTAGETVPENAGRVVRITVEYILKHYQEPISLTKCAQVAGVNPAYLSYVFKQEMKIGFSSFLLSQRLKCAEEMLTNTNLKIREVAEKSGFNDYHYFSKVFRKKNGVSPAEFRRQNS